MLKCLTFPFRSVSLRKAGAAQGYAILTLVGGQARLADLRMVSEDQLDWNAAVAITTKELLNACEVIAL